MPQEAQLQDDDIDLLHALKTAFSQNGDPEMFLARAADQIRQVEATIIDTCTKHRLRIDENLYALLESRDAIGEQTAELDKCAQTASDITTMVDDALEGLSSRMTVRRNLDAALAVAARTRKLTRMYARVEDTIDGKRLYTGLRMLRLLEEETRTVLPDSVLKELVPDTRRLRMRLTTQALRALHAWLVGVRTGFEVSVGAYAMRHAASQAAAHHSMMDAPRGALGEPFALLPLLPPPPSTTTTMPAAARGGGGSSRDAGAGGNNGGASTADSDGVGGTSGGGGSGGGGSGGGGGGGGGGGCGGGVGALRPWLPLLTVDASPPAADGPDAPCALPTTVGAGMTSVGGPFGSVGLGVVGGGLPATTAAAAAAATSTAAVAAAVNATRRPDIGASMAGGEGRRSRVGVGVGDEAPIEPAPTLYLRPLLQAVHAGEGLGLLAELRGEYRKERLAHLQRVLDELDGRSGAGVEEGDWGEGAVRVAGRSGEVGDSISNTEKNSQGRLLRGKGQDADENTEDGEDGEDGEEDDRMDVMARAKSTIGGGGGHRRVSRTRGIETLACKVAGFFVVERAVEAHASHTLVDREVVDGEWWSLAYAKLLAVFKQHEECGLETVGDKARVRGVEESLERFAETNGLIR